VSLIRAPGAAVIALTAPHRQSPALDEPARQLERPHCELLLCLCWVGRDVECLYLRTCALLGRATHASILTVHFPPFLPASSRGYAGRLAVAARVSLLPRLLLALPFHILFVCVCVCVKRGLTYLLRVMFTGVDSYEVSLENQTAVVHAKPEDLSYEKVLETIKKTGKKVNSAEVDGVAQSIEVPAAA
jgi:copper chaperone CopZ